MCVCVSVCLCVCVSVSEQIPADGCTDFDAVFVKWLLLFSAVAVSMRTIVLAEQLGIEALTQSFGIVALFQGIAFTVNAPIAGR